MGDKYSIIEIKDFWILYAFLSANPGLIHRRIVAQPFYLLLTEDLGQVICFADSQVISKTKWSAGEVDAKAKKKSPVHCKDSVKLAHITDSLEEFREMEPPGRLRAQTVLDPHTE